MTPVQSLYMLVTTHTESEVQRIITNGINEYAEWVTNIAIDIYDSCIGDYYAKYTPKVYTRHGDLTGSNLYKANDIGLDGSILHIGFNEDSLLPYGTSDDIRAEVLSNVINGVRGSKERTKTKKKWPEKWITSYPNSHSIYKNAWHSSANTIDSIYDDFMASIFTDTYDKLWQFINKYM